MSDAAFDAKISNSLELAMRARTAGDLSRALQILEQLLATGYLPQSDDGRTQWALAHYECGLLYRAQNRNREALQRFEHAVAFAPHLKEARVQIVELTFHDTHPSDATKVEHYIDSVEKGTNRQLRFQILNRLQGLLRIRLTDQRETLRWRMDQLTALHRVAPEINYPKLYLARGYYILEKWREAISFLSQLTGTADETFDVLNILGRSHEKLGEVEKARAAYEMSLQLTPQQAGIHFRIGRILLAQSEIKRP